MADEWQRAMGPPWTEGLLFSLIKVPIGDGVLIIIPVEIFSPPRELMYSFQALEP